MQQDSGDWVRFSLYSDGSKLWAFGASTVGNQSTQRLRTAVSAGSSLWLRVSRAGSTWSMSYSSNGSSWSSVGSFSQSLTAVTAGVYAGDSASSGSAPGFTALVDYFFNQASPISPEDPVSGGGGGNTTPPVIAIWYGDHQTFGTHSQSQNWINILGNVSDASGVTSLSYTLNGASSNALTIGPDKRRLESAGDFNADIPWTSLSAGDNAVVIRAVDGAGNVATKAITVTRINGAVPTLPYTIDWSTSTPLNDQAQVVDGKWEVTSSGLHIQQMGYDRLVDVGSIAFKDFEVTVPVTVQSGFGPDAFKSPSNQPLVGLGLRWQGHTSIDAAQPAWWWYPTGALAWFRWYTTPKVEIRGNNDTPDLTTNANMAFGTSYIFKARVQTQANGSTTYSFKMWQSGSAEPSAWNETATVSGGPSAGSVILIAHQVNATFGSISFTAIS